MILPSTIRKLQSKNATVVRVVWPAHTVKIPAHHDGKFTTPASEFNTTEIREYFATRRQAEERVVSQTALIRAGFVPRFDMRSIPARALDIFTGRELAPEPVTVAP